ncbi:UDP-glucose dehydrogenase family protein [Bacillus suaedaesalsae]|uniref:UDP-glucose 6-dehydrogenase n=1 Tax=Bacillus suaedaesalsae TaxID=2810349 RepID=A0ABS2DPD9_9BACI|nr:UDP-glucose/GDP-mannose dehydrogenase family protein [Bacillus suaedaesalsae]MBM6619528.1 UDP-glucose/GDP-mannose dehydrogenase family protein [Bacillus suaedaesalsae]
MRRITVMGTGYVGLVTGVCLSEIGHHVICLDIDQGKIHKLQQGISPIYEPGLEEMMVKNLENNRLSFTSCQKEALSDVEVIYLAVGTPQQNDGTADLTYLFKAVQDICSYTSGEVVVVVKSTVPVGTNEKIHKYLTTHASKLSKFNVVSNPEFLREGQAIHDSFYGDRIVIGSTCEEAARLLYEINESFNMPIIHTDCKSSEMIKYASNAFLATKISFINEISSICERVGADIEAVAYGMGQDSRIGSQFLQAGIGYGGSCFPKDTKALVQIAGDVKHKFELLESVIRVNNKQQLKLIEKARSRLTCFKERKVALLGLAFKPNTDDVRESAAIVLARKLAEEGARVIAYDPVAIEKTKAELGDWICYTTDIKECLDEAEVAFIATEWDEIKQLPLEVFVKMMKTPIIFDGRNCFSLQEVKKYEVDYYAIGRPPVLNLSIQVLVH